MLFSLKYIWRYIFVISVLVVISYFGNHIKGAFNTTAQDEEHEMIKKYLLNDSPLYGFNKPKLWIHTKYDVNARKWKDFYSRNTSDLNQPYIHLTIKSIIDHCNHDFHICLIDDQSFSKLIPSWKIDLVNVAEPKKTQLREIGIAELLHNYGGMVVPNSFLCTKNLIGLYNEGLQDNRAFVCENVNRTCDAKQQTQSLFIPDTFCMGAKKHDAEIKQYVEYLKNRNVSGHFTSEFEFVGDNSKWAMTKIQEGKINLIDGELLGLKTNKSRKQILLEDLIEEQPLDISPKSYGIYIPEDEILLRPKYQWFAVMDGRQILQSNMIISKYMQSAIKDSESIYEKQSEIKSVISI